MRKVAVVLALGTLALQASLAFAANAPLWGKEVDGLACRLVVGGEFCVGEAIPATVEIRNVSKETRYLVGIYDILYPKHARLEIAGPNGPMPKPSRSAQCSPGPGSLKPIAPGEVARFEFADLSDYFSSWDRDDRLLRSRFQAPGDYRLTYSFFGMRLPQRMAVGERITNGQRETIYETLPEEKVRKTWAATLVSNTAAFTLRELRDDEFAAHEWGVFTVFNDLKYANANRKAEWSSLPPYFYRQFPTMRLKWAPAAWDKPIVYFYCTRPTLKVDVKVTFADGAPVAWWPCCASPIDQGTGRVAVKTPEGVFRTLHWSAWLGGKPPIPADPNTGPRAPLRVDPSAPRRAKEPEPPPCPWLGDARLKDASPVTVVGTKVQRSAPWASSQRETERFIYYDGLVPAPGGLSCVAAARGSVTLKNAAAYPIRDLFIVDRRQAEGRTLGFAHVVEPIAAGEQRQVALASIAMPAAREAVEKALVAAGLFEAEAASIVKIWDQGFFGAPGVTAFYLLPRAEYDRMLPLEIRPAPKRLVRIGIALHPQIAVEPELAARAQRLIAQLADPDAAKREAAAKELAPLGPVAWRLMREALKGSPAPQAAKAINEILGAADATDWLRQAAKSYRF